MEKILIIEDEKNIRASIVEILQFHGFNVVSAKNGKIGLETVAAEKPDLIICDIMMPKMDGFEVLKKLYSNPEFNTPFIFLTAMVQYDNLRDGMNLGADDYIFKPFKSVDLIKIINTKLSKRSKTTHEIQQKTKDLEMLISLMTGHEFNTPMHGIISMSKFIKDNLSIQDDDKLNDYFKYLELSTNRLQATFNKIKLLHELQVLGKDGRLENEACSAENHIRKVAESIAEVQHRKKDLLIDNLEDAIIPVKTNLFYTAVYEIIENAFKFSEPGDKVHVSAKRKGGNFEVIISDAGSKIRAEELSTYRTFRQFDRNKNEQQGLGVGLALVMGILEYYSGSITFSDKRPRGIQVVLSFKI